jgi:tRNA-splicing ligase RtcB
MYRPVFYRYLTMSGNGTLTQIDAFRYLLPRSYKQGMRIDGMVYADESLMAQIGRDQTLEQVANVASLPGLVGRSLAMPDAHQGYGFCIGGVAASDYEEGIVSAGGVGFDINCGVRLLATPFQLEEIVPHLGRLIEQLFRDIPCGTGRTGRMAMTGKELDAVLTDGAGWAAARGYGTPADCHRIEDYGRLSGAEPGAVSERARERGKTQLGTLGSGNHFLEIQVVDALYDAPTASRFGLRDRQVVVLIHSGSRGLGHQVCTDHLDAMQRSMGRYKLSVCDRQLACVPIGSAEGQSYLRAMTAAANFAFANRQMITHWTREVFRRLIGAGDLTVVYDVCHNIAKTEQHTVDGISRKVLVHRKGATRAFPKGHAALPADLADAGQPVLIPGSMGTASYVLVGTERAMAETFGSSCHGAGRAMSRTQAKRETTTDELFATMKERNILVRGDTRAGLVEEKPDAYKDVDHVVAVIHGAGIARKVARLRPLAVMKG